MSKKTISLKEPAERPMMLALSHAEVHQLVQYHKKQAKACVSEAVKICAKEKLNSAQFKALQKLVEGQIDAHYARARGLMSLLNLSMENSEKKEGK